MYKNNLVMSISCGGKFLQETKDGEVFLPFLSEYSVYIKNKYTKKASVSVLIDGKDVLNGRRIVLNPQESFNLERFLEDSLEEGRKFRFIKKTPGIIEHRGNKPEDSLVEVRYKFEYIPKTYYNDGPYVKKYNDFGTMDGPVTFAINGTQTLDGGPSFNVQSNCIGGFSKGIPSLDVDKIYESFGAKRDTSLVKGTTLSETTSENISLPFQETEEGITVKGSESKQKFKNTFHFQTENEEHVMILKLRGTSKQEKEVVEAVTKTTKKVCTVCGKKWDYNFTYCPDDASYLEEE